MASITKQSLSFATAVTLTELTGTDTLDSTQGTLWISNQSGASVTINVDGDGGSEVTCTGVGVVDVTGGYDITVADGEIIPVQLATISQFLQGTVAVTGGTSGVFVYLI